VNEAVAVDCCLVNEGVECCERGSRLLTNEVFSHCAKSMKALNSKFHDHHGDYEA